MKNSIQQSQYFSNSYALTNKKNKNLNNKKSPDKLLLNNPDTQRKKFKKPKLENAQSSNNDHANYQQNYMLSLKKQKKSIPDKVNKIARRNQNCYEIKKYSKSKSNSSKSQMSKETNRNQSSSKYLKSLSKEKLQKKLSKNIHNKSNKKQLKQEKQKGNPKLTVHIFHNTIIKNIKSNTIPVKKKTINNSIQAISKSNRQRQSSKQSYTKVILNKSDQIMQTSVIHHIRHFQIYHIQPIQINNSSSKHEKDQKKSEKKIQKNQNISLLKGEIFNQKLLEFQPNEQVERKFKMLEKNREITPISNEGISTNLCSVLKYFQTIKIYISPLKKSILKKIEVPYGLSVLEKLRSFQEYDQEQQLQENHKQQQILPLYIFEEIEQMMPQFPNHKFQIIHHKCLFDCINEILQSLRPFYQYESQPYPWQPSFKQRNSLNDIFKTVKNTLIDYGSILKGLQINNKSQNRENEQIKLDKNYTTDFIIQIVFQIADLIFEELIDDFENSYFL